MHHLAELSQNTQPPEVPFHWNTMECAGMPLHLSATLASGQNFRWRRNAAGIWWGVVENTIVAAWQASGQPDSPLYWQTFPEPDCRELIVDYFRLDVDLDSLYAEWLRSEPCIAESIADFRGLRVLRQPPVECFFAFQCAACNTVVKIERSVAHLAAHYGQPLTIGSRLGRSSQAELQSDSQADFFAFPTLESLAAADEATLRSGMWGYRAPRVIALARHLLSQPEGWLESLRTVPYAEAHAALMELHGVGAKLADCICLFALDKDEAVPVDTHVRQIGCRLFVPDMAARSLTPRVYSAIADAYRDRFGNYAGWAQQYLFFGELRRASDFLLPCDRS